MVKTKDGKAGRTVAVLNLFAGMVIMLVLLFAVNLGGQGYFVTAMGLFLGCIGIVWYRIHCVFKVIE